MGELQIAQSMDSEGEVSGGVASTQGASRERGVGAVSLGSAPSIVSMEK